MRAIYGQGVLFDRQELVKLLRSSAHSSRNHQGGPEWCVKCELTRALAELDEPPPPAAYARRRRNDDKPSQAELADWARRTGGLAVDPPTELPGFDLSDMTFTASVCATCGDAAYACDRTDCPGSTP